MKSRRKPWRKQGGAELVEFMVTLPIILALVFIFLEFAVALCDQAVLTNASRAAAREVIRGGSDSDATAAAQTILPSMIAWNEGGTGASVTVVPNDGARGANDPGRDITVTVTYPFDFVWLPNFFAGLSDLTLSATTVMREQKY